MSMPEPEPASSAGRTTICHIPPGNPDQAHTIRVGAPAVRAHLAHGDRVGECEAAPPPHTCGGVGVDCMATPCCPGLACVTPHFEPCHEDSFDGCSCQVLLD